MTNSIMLKKNDFLSESVRGYYSCYYKGYYQEGNPRFLNDLKNTFDSYDVSVLENARNKVVDEITAALPDVIHENGLEDCMLVSVPRAKSEGSYTATQRMFRQAVALSAKELGVESGVYVISRHTNTRTTHFRRPVTNYVNDGALPYPGITIATCKIDCEKIKGRDIILIDDIYTEGVNIDEDCVQALLDCGARKVVFYAVAYTYHGGNEDAHLGNCS